MKNIIREMGEPDFRFYFEGDVYTAAAGDFGYTVFCIMDRCCVLNEKEYEDITKEYDYVMYEIDNGIGYSYKNVKEVMEDYKLPYSPKNAHILKDLCENGYKNETESFCKYLSIKTGKNWDYKQFWGYCQGDYCEIVFCKDFYEEKSIDIMGNLSLGCGKEFCVITLDEDGNEEDRCCGYYVADCQTYEPEEYKRLVCEWAGIDPEETKLELIDGYHTYTKYDYKEY